MSGQSDPKLEKKRTKSRRYYWANLEKQRARKKAYHEKNKERLNKKRVLLPMRKYDSGRDSQYHREYYRQNKERLLRLKKLRVLKNKEVFNEKAREYRRSIDQLSKLEIPSQILQEELLDTMNFADESNQLLMRLMRSLDESCPNSLNSAAKASKEIREMLRLKLETAKFVSELYKDIK